MTRRPYDREAAYRTRAAAFFGESRRAEWHWGISMRVFGTRVQDERGAVAILAAYEDERLGVE